MIKYYFSFAQSNLNNKPTHQITVCSNCSLMSFSKLSYLFDVFWPIIATLVHFPVFQNEKDSETGIVLFVVMLYLLRVCKSLVHVLMFLLHFLIFACFYNQFDWYDNIIPINCRIANHLVVIKMTLSCLQKLLGIYILLIYQKKGYNSGFLGGIQWYLVRAAFLRLGGLMNFKFL